MATEKLFIPSGPKPRTALFVALHGCLSHAEDSEQITRMSEFAEKHGFYVWYPEPSMGEDSRGCFNFYTTDSQRPGSGDGAQIVAQIEKLLKLYDIDKEKVFVIGMSGGASLVSLLTSCYPDVIKGAAIHSGMGYGLASDWQESLFIAQTGPLAFRERNTACTPSNYKGKLMLIHGSRDQIMNPRHYYALQNDYLAGITPTSNFVSPTLNRYGYIHESFYQGATLRGQGIYVIGMNHDWSGSSPNIPLTPIGPDVSAMIVDYFLDIK
jgi:poly(hydroxyalkanoate) depolymerase family esterase